MLKVKIVDPNQIVFEGEAEFVSAPSIHGNLGILPMHTPFFAELTSGDILIKTEKEQLYAIASGIIKVRDDEVTILVTSK